MKKIAVITTPRTGSNLLCMSLAQHSGARWAGELFNPYYSWCGPTTVEVLDSEDAIEDGNLFKLFYSDYRAHRSEFVRCIAACDVVIHLRRRDRDAQLRSWELASSTGKWRAEESDGKPCPMPADPISDILKSDAAFARYATLTVDYERMVEDWGRTIATILGAAEWPLEALPMATAKLPASEAGL